MPRIVTYLRVSRRMINKMILTHLRYKLDGTPQAVIEGRHRRRLSGIIGEFSEVPPGQQVSVESIYWQHAVIRSDHS